MNAIKTLCCLAALALVAACSSTPTIEDKPSSEFEGLNKVSGSGFSEAWVRPGADLPAYQVISASPLVAADAEIIQPSQSLQTRVRRDLAMTPELEQRLAEAWDNAIHNAASSQGLATDGAGDQVLRIDAAMTRLAPSVDFAAERSTPGRTTVYSEDSGEAAIEFRLYDQASDELLAVIRDSSRVGAPVWSRSNTVTASADLRNMYSRWATRLVARITGN